MFFSTPTPTPTPATPLSHLAAITPATAPDPLRPQAERQIALLGELAELGMDVARAVAGRAKAAGPEEDLNALAMAFSRVSRAVRLTIMLQSKLANGLPEAEPEVDEAFERSEGHKLRVERVVERLLRAEHRDEDEFDRLRAEVSERLDDEDLYGDVLNRPIGELVALICRDLGLEPDWTRLAQEAWAKEEIASGPAGSPFSPSPLMGEGRDGGDLPAAPQLDSHPHPQPFPHQGGRESASLSFSEAILADSS